MERMRREERARQFMPFASLRGFGELIREQERVYVPKKELSEEDAERLSKRLAFVEKGVIVRAVYYDRDAYVTVEGAVTEADHTLRYLRVIKTRIAFDDLKEIKILS